MNIVKIGGAPMYAPATQRVRLLLLSLPLSGLLLILGVLARGRSLDPSVAPQAFAAAAVAAGAATGWLTIFIGMVVELLGMVAMGNLLSGGRRARLAFWGMALSLFGIALVLPLIGFMALAAPIVGRMYLAGQQEVIDIAVAVAADGPALVLAIISGVLYCAGSICFGLAMRDVLPRPLVAGYILQAPLLTFVALVSFEAEFLGALLLLISGAWLAWRTWTSPSPAAAHEPAMSGV